MAEELTYEKAFPSRFLKAGLFDGKTVTLTIESGFMETLEGDKGKESKLILRFKQGSIRELVTNKTNAYCIAQMFGNKIGAWTGKRVAFYPTKADFGPKKVDAIRVFGSPDIAEDIPIAQRIGKKMFKTTLKSMRTGPQTQQQTPPPPTTEEPTEDGLYDFSKVDVDPEANYLPDADELAGEMVP